MGSRKFKTYFLTPIIFFVGYVNLAYGQSIISCSPEKPTALPSDTIRVRAFTQVLANQPLNYSWSVTGGQIIKKEDDVKWIFSGVTPGSYKATVEVTDSLDRVVSCSFRVILRLPLINRALINRDPLRETGGAFLKPEDTLQKEYGLYSFLLFGSPPNEATIERYREVIKTYLEFIPEIRLLEKYIPLDELNITYIPIETSEKKNATVDWILENYDYIRARTILRDIPGNLRNGPYIVSLREPTTSMKVGSKPYLFQDLSTVPKNLISLWLKEFLNQAAQERFWEENEMEMFTLKLRTSIAVLAKGLGDVRDAIDNWVTWIYK